MLKPKKRLTKKQIKEDKFVTYYFKAQDYVQKNQKIVSSVIIGIIAVVAISILFVRSKRAAEANASIELARAESALQESNLNTAIDMLKSLADNYSGTKNAGRAVFQLANVYFERQDYEMARQYYEQYLDDYGSDEIMASSAYSGIGASLEQREEFLEAAYYYKKGAEKFPEHFEAARQLMNAARCFRLANNKVEAKELYQRIIDDYPESNVVRNAEMMLSELQG
jgi:TolA-binding protein